MIKKIAKIVLLVLMVVGVFITFSNFMEPELNGAAGKWVQKKKIHLIAMETVTHVLTPQVARLSMNET